MNVVSGSQEHQFHRCAHCTLGELAWQQVWRQSGSSFFPLWLKSEPYSPLYAKKRLEHNHREHQALCSDEIMFVLEPRVLSIYMSLSLHQHTQRHTHLYGKGNKIKAMSCRFAQNSIRSSPPTLKDIIWMVIIGNNTNVSFNGELILNFEL